MKGITSYFKAFTVTLNLWTTVKEIISLRLNIWKVIKNLISQMVPRLKNNNI